MQNHMPPKRFSAWPRAIGVAGLGLAAVLGGVWLVRAPLADAVLRQVLKDRGVAGDWRISHLGSDEIGLNTIRLGDAQSPDLTIESARIGWRWTIAGPKLDTILLTRPALALGVDRNGLQLGDLAKFAGPPSADAAALPDFALTITDGQIALATPAGMAHGRIDAAGRIGADFKAEMALTAPGAPPTATPALTGSLTAPPSGPQLAFSGRFEAVTWEGIELRGLQVQGAAKAPRDLATAELRFVAAASAIELGDTQIGYAGGDGAVSISRFGPGLRLDAWRGGGVVQAQTIASAAAAGADLALHWDAAGDSAKAAGSWRLAADRAESAGIAAGVAGAGQFTLAADLALDAEGALGLTAPKTGAAVKLRLPELAGSPLQPLMADATPKLNRALAAYEAQAPIRLRWRKDRGQVDLAGPVSAQARSGARLTADGAPDKPFLSLTLPGGALQGGGAVTLSGGGLPEIEATLAPFAFSADKRDVATAFRVRNWRADGAALNIDNGQFRLDGASPDAAFRFTGDVAMTGPLAGGAVRHARGRVDLVGTLGKTFRIGPAGRDLRLRFDGLDLANLRFSAGDLALSADASGAFARIDPSGRLSGGVSLAPLRLSGVTSDGLPARLELAALSGALSGTPAAIGFSGQAQTVRLAMDLAGNRTVQISAASAPFAAAFTGSGWQIDGKAQSGAVEDPTLPAHVDDLTLAWRMTPAGKDVRITISDGAGRVTDKEAKPRFNPLRLANVSGALADGVFTSEGAILLQSNGAALAHFTGRHALETGAGAAQVRVRDLTFSPSLEVFELTELARGVVENARGPVDGDFQARWSPAAFQVDGTLALKNLSAATAGLGPIEGISGTIKFDDLTLLTTPPGQRLKIASLNPGIEVRDGDIAFQLKRDGVVALQSATFPFAKGRLSVEPVEVTIGAPESRYTLRLKNVDVAAFVEEMKFKELTATGTIEGAFPLLITPNRAILENGRITAGPSGGVIQYRGPTSDSIKTGTAGIAFQALQGFRYDQLEIDMNGPLDGEVIANLRFRGVNVAPVDVAPGLGRIARAEGLPFRFNVSVKAPFRALAENANRFINPLDQFRAAQPLPPPQ